MAGYRALGLLLAAAALTATAARAADDDHMYNWNCFKSCTDRCYDDNDKAAAEDGGLHLGAGNDTAASAAGVSLRCKAGCLKECFQYLPALCYQQCVVTTCIFLPPYSKGKIVCLKSCSDKCSHLGSAPPPPPPPSPRRDDGLRPGPP